MKRPTLESRRERVRRVNAKRPSDSNERSVAPRLRRCVLERDGYRCRKCGTDHAPHGAGMHIHHVIPWADGGRTTLENLHSLCGMCHAEISWLWRDRPPVPYEQWLEMPPAAVLVRMLLAAASRDPVISADAACAALGISASTAAHLLKGRAA